ncbi:hypothetical protein L7F22_005705 [Adiantum nelumboides]|nr:hypothetical protein [Adiantum nelumboides]
MGAECELFRKGGAQLFLVDGDESALLQRGEFTLLLVKHSRSPLAAIVAMVGDMQWPVGKDSIVSKLGNTGFSFSNLPARLRFALSLEHLDLAEMQKLELLFQEYATFAHADRDLTQEAADFWTRLAGNLECTDTPENPPLDALATIFPVQRSGTMDAPMSPKLVQRMQQARRMSAVEKLFARSIERGTINPSTHVKKADTDIYTDLALASVDAVAKVVEAVETAGKTLLESAQAAGTDWVESTKLVQTGGKQVAEGLDAVGSLLSSAWTLNKVGLRMLFRTIASINSSAGMRTASQSPSVSSATDGSSHSSATSDLGSLSSSTSKPPSASADYNAAQVHSASLSLGALSTQTGTSPLGISASPARDHITSKCLQAAAAGPSLQCRPVLPVHYADRSNTPRPPMLPPRFHGGTVASDDRMSGVHVTTALSLASGGSAGPACTSSCVYRPHATQFQAAQTLTAMARMPSPPCPPRPPPRPPPPPRPRRPFH